MLKTFVRLLGDQAPALHCYLILTLAYAVLCALTLLSVLPILSALLEQRLDSAGYWLLLLLAELLLCRALRLRVEKSGVRVGIAVLQNGRHLLGTHLASLPPGWFSASNSARVGHLAAQGMMELAQLPAHVFTPLLCGLLTPLILLPALLLLDLRLGLIATLALPLLALVFIASARFGQRADQIYRRHTAEASQRLLEFAQAQATLRAFNGEGGGSRSLEQAISQQQSSAQRMIRLSALSVLFNSTAVQSCFAALLAVALLLPGPDLQNPQALVLALLLCLRFVEPLLDVAGYSEVLRAAHNQLQQVREVLNQTPLAEPENPQTPADASVELEHVSFRYPGVQQDLLRAVSLRVEAGSMTALVGASGSGKTTLLRMIARFFDTDQGCVRIGGVDVRQLGSRQLARQISQIFQDNYLFQGSIGENIRLGRPEASDEELQEAIDLAGVQEILERLPEGLQTQVGEAGVRLSGGERQRICIARALLKDAPILLVDEATAALDAENQAAIGAVLQRLRGSRTLIVIAHQLATVAQADQILVLERGSLVEAGSHQQLIERNGAYARLLASRQAAQGWRIGAAVDNRGKP